MLPIRAALSIELPPKKLPGLTLAATAAASPAAVGVAQPERGEVTPENAPLDGVKSCDSHQQTSLHVLWPCTSALHAEAVGVWCRVMRYNKPMSHVAAAVVRNGVSNDELHCWQMLT